MDKSEFVPEFTVEFQALDIAKAFWPFLISLENAGLMPDTYDEDILAPEWMVFQ